MKYFNIIKTILFVLLLNTFHFLQAQKVIEPSGPPDWSKPYQPFRIVGNLYYVGTYDLACYLLVTPQGNILINTGLAGSATTIANSIKELGLKIADTKILLTTQAHYDHMGAMAAIKKSTGAKMMMNEKDAAVAKDGGSSDYALGNGKPSFAPVSADGILKNGDSITLGNTTVIMLNHPGHTKGSCSYLINVPDGNKTYRVLIANMPTIVTSKKFSEIPAYPEIEKDYAYTLDAMKKLSFDLWLSSHAGQFNLHSKRKPNDAYNPNAFSGRADYDAELERLNKEFVEHKK